MPDTDLKLPVATSKKSKITKLDLIISLLSRADGASLGELTEATGWQTHSVRGAIAGSLKEKRI